MQGAGRAQTPCCRCCGGPMPAAARPRRPGRRSAHLIQLGLRCPASPLMLCWMRRCSNSVGDSLVTSKATSCGRRQAWAGGQSDSPHRRRSKHLISAAPLLAARTWWPYVAPQSCPKRSRRPSCTTRRPPLRKPEARPPRATGLSACGCQGPSGDSECHTSSSPACMGANQRAVGRAAPAGTQALPCPPRPKPCASLRPAVGARTVQGGAVPAVVAA